MTNIAAILLLLLPQWKWIKHVAMTNIATVITTMAVIAYAKISAVADFFSRSNYFYPRNITNNSAPPPVAIMTN